jgi:hypothetical protein
VQRHDLAFGIREKHKDRCRLSCEKGSEPSRMVGAWLVVINAFQKLVLTLVLNALKKRAQGPPRCLALDLRSRARTVWRTTSIAPVRDIIWIGWAERATIARSAAEKLPISLQTRILRIICKRNAMAVAYAQSEVKLGRLRTLRKRRERRQRGAKDGDRSDQ